MNNIIKKIIRENEKSLQNNESVLFVDEDGVQKEIYINYNNEYEIEITK